MTSLPFASLFSLEGFGVLGLLFWLWMIAECWKRERPGLHRWGWLLLVVLLPEAGALIYFLVRVLPVGRLKN